MPRYHIHELYAVRLLGAACRARLSRGERALGDGARSAHDIFGVNEGPWAMSRLLNGYRVGDRGGAIGKRQVHLRLSNFCPTQENENPARTRGSFI